MKLSALVQKKSLVSSLGGWEMYILKKALCRKVFRTILKLKNRLGTLDIPAFQTEEEHN